MQDKSINGALLALRKQIIRGDLDGLAHVEALLVMRGVDMPNVLPAKRADVALKGHMAALIIDTLRDSAKPLREIAAHVASKRPEIDERAAYVRTTQALDRLKRRGWVVQDFGPDGCLWRLAP